MQPKTALKTIKKPARSGATKSEQGKPLSLTTWIFIGLTGGILTGLFIGEYADNLKFIGDIYIGLMQMTVLPYIVFSLIGNIGRLSIREVRMLAKYGLLTFVGLWLLACLTVLIFSGAFPEQSIGKFFSTSMVDPPPRLNLVNLFIPSNPFRSLADNAVPAVVIFCLLFAVSIIGFEEKKSLLDHVSLIARALHRVNGYVVKLTPMGVFGIAANAAGTMTLTEFERLQGYYLGFGASVLVLSFVLLPLIVVSCTPFGYRQILLASRNALLTAFVTGSVFPVIPLLIDGVNDLFSAHFRNDPRHAEFPEFILPLAYPFPDSGNVVDLIFISFAAWFVGDPLSLGQSLYMLGTSFFLLFGKVYLTIPFLLNSLQVPQDMFQLFLAAGVLAARVGDVLSSMHFLVFTILTTAAMSGLLNISWRKIAWAVGIGLGTMLLVAVSMHFLLKNVGVANGQDAILAHMDLLEGPVHSEIERTGTPNPVKLSPGQNRLQRIKQRGKIRVGFRPDNLPYSYFNADGKLVGFDIDFMSRLALDLGIGIEFVPYQSSTLLEQIKQDHFDIAASGITDTLERSSNTLMTESYLVVNMGLVVKDHNRDEFESMEKIARIPHPRIGVIRGSYFDQRAREYFSTAEIVPLDSPREFFEEEWRQLDALAMHAESGAAWTLVYPSHSVVNPLNRRESAPVSIAVAGYDLVLDDMLNTWIMLKKMDGTTDKLFEHWMMGKTPGVRPPRWSILRDVLHWLD